MITYHDHKVQTVINTLIEQRNQALDTLAVKIGELEEANATIAALSAKNAELQKSLDQPPAEVPAAAN